jgi:putative CocE/NonD family hydrolase
MTNAAAVTVIENLRIPMPCGITLSARVWMPDDADTRPMPAILEILPYRKRDGTTGRDETTHARFSTHGYVCLRVDLRGTGESDGLFTDEYSEQELQDVAATIEWIAAQNWCTGAVGIMGISWGGFNGLQVAARRPTGLKAVISMCTSVDRYADDIHFKGGCQLTENLGWAATAMSWFSTPPDPMIAGDNWRDIWLNRLENTPFLIGDWAGHTTRDDYWKHGSVCEDFAQIEVPVLVLGGWHDGYRNTAAKLLSGGTSGPVKAIMGPWNHNYPHIAAPAPQMDFIQEAIAWWDHWLKGEQNGVEDMPDYRAYVMDGIAPKANYDHRPGQWLAFDKWPVAGVTETQMDFGDNTFSGAMLTPVSVDTNPKCGRQFGEYFPYGFGPGELPDDQRAEDKMSVCFDDDPIEAPLTVFGAPKVTVNLSSNQTFGQIAVRLCDVAPDGASTLITFGVLNLQCRNGYETHEPLVPDTTYAIEMMLDQAAYVVPEGHSIRLAVSPSYWPYIWPERGAVTLTISGGHMVLPTLDDEAGHGITMPEPDFVTAPVTRTIRDGHEAKTLETEAGKDVLTISGDYGEVEFIEHGLRISSAMTEVWSIDHDDVNGATAQIDWDRGLVRGDIAISTRVNMTMSCDADAYYISAKLRAFEHETFVFEREFHDRIPR